MIDTDWYLSASCRGSDVESWFRGHETKSSEGELRMLTNICASCPVRVQCLASAMKAEGKLPGKSRGGIYGGLTPQQRGDLAQGAQLRTEPEPCPSCNRPTMVARRVARPTCCWGCEQRIRTAAARERRAEERAKTPDRAVVAAPR